MRRSSNTHKYIRESCRMAKCCSTALYTVLEICPMIVSINSKPPASANSALKIWQSHLYYRLRQTDIDQISAFVKSRFSNARYSIRHDGFRVGSRVFFSDIRFQSENRPFAFFLLLHHLIWAALPPVRPFVTSIRRGIRPLTSSTWEMMPISR